MADERIKLEGQDAVDLWQQGKDAWNAWVEANPVADVIFDETEFTRFNEVSFSHFKFPTGSVSFVFVAFGDGHVSFFDTEFGNGEVSFHGATFGVGEVSFDGATFGVGRVDFTSTSFGDGLVVFVDTNFGDGDVYFQNATFGDADVTFEDAQFGDGDVYFRGALFGNGDVSFRKVTFGVGNVAFNQAVFKGSLSIPDPKNTAFIKSMSFKGCAFESTLTLEGKFKCVPDLRGTITKAHVDLQGLRITPDFKGPPEKTAAALRRLKELAEANRHHDAALRYHADEKRALRPTLPRAAQWLDWSFDLVSNYGQSIGRPAVALLAVFLAFTALYSAPLFAAAKCETVACSALSRLAEAFSFSLTNILPFVASARAVRVDASEALFGENPGFWIDLASMA